MEGKQNQEQEVCFGHLIGSTSWSVLYAMTCLHIVLSDQSCKVVPYYEVKKLSYAKIIKVWAPENMDKSYASTVCLKKKVFFDWLMKLMR